MVYLARIIKNNQRITRTIVFSSLLQLFDSFCSLSGELWDTGSGILGALIHRQCYSLPTGNHAILQISENLSRHVLIAAHSCPRVNGLFGCVMCMTPTQNAIQRVSYGIITDNKIVMWYQSQQKQRDTHQQRRREHLTYNQPNKNSSRKTPIKYVRSFIHLYSVLSNRQLVSEFEQFLW